MEVSSEICAACGASALVHHQKVSGALGSDGLIPTSDQFGTALADIARCPSCGHMQLERFPSEELLAGAYEDAASDDYVDEEAGQRETAHRALARIERHVEPGALLDVGCWVGFLLAEAERRGWEAVGLEPSRFAQRYARERLGLSVLEGELFTADLPRNHFQAVVLGDVLEHLPRAGNALDRITQLLAPGGVLWLTVPDAGSRVARVMGSRWWSVIPTHVHYFTDTSLALMLANHGYEVVYRGTDPKAFTVRYYLNRISGYSRALSGALVGAAEKLGVAHRLWAPDFRDRMAVIARRTGG